MVEKFPYKGKKGRYKKGKWVYISSFVCWLLMVVFNKENGCSLSLQSSWEHIWKVQSERSCSKRWVFIVDGCKIYFPQGQCKWQIFCLSVNVCKIYFPQGRWKWQAGTNVTWASMVRISSLQPDDNGSQHVCQIFFYSKGKFIIHIFPCNKKQLNIFLFFLKGNCNTNPCRSRRRKRVSGDIESGSMVEKRRKEKNNKKKRAKEKMTKERKAKGKKKKEKRKKKEKKAIKKKKWKNIYALLKRLQSWLLKRLKNLASHEEEKSMPECVLNTYLMKQVCALSACVDKSNVMIRLNLISIFGCSSFHNFHHSHSV